MAGPDTTTTGNFRHSLFINDTFDFLENFEDGFQEESVVSGGSFEENDKNVENIQDRAVRKGKDGLEKFQDLDVGAKRCNGNAIVNCSQVTGKNGLDARPREPNDISKTKDTFSGPTPHMSIESTRDIMSDSSKLVEPTEPDEDIGSHIDPAGTKNVTKKSSQISRFGPSSVAMDVQPSRAGMRFHGNRGSGDELTMEGGLNGVDAMNVDVDVQTTMCTRANVASTADGAKLRVGPGLSNSQENLGRCDSSESTEKSGMSNSAASDLAKEDAERSKGVPDDSGGNLDSGQKCEVSVSHSAEKMHKNLGTKDSQNSSADSVVSLEKTAENSTVKNSGKLENLGYDSENAVKPENSRRLEKSDSPEKSENSGNPVTICTSKTVVNGKCCTEKTADSDCDALNGDKCQKPDFGLKYLSNGRLITGNSETDLEVKDFLMRKKYSDINDDSSSSKSAVDSDLESEVKVVLRRSAANSPSRFSESSSRGTSEDEDDDEDAGVYAETHRYSHWMFADDEGKLHLTPVLFEDGDAAPSNGEPNDVNDDAFIEPELRDQSFSRSHRRLESQSSTASEREFKRKYQHVSRKVVKRKSSCQMYERLSERICEPEHEVTLERESGEQGFGFHIKGTQPTYISTVVPESIADEAGVIVGEIIVSVNGINCMEATHDEVIEQLKKEPNKVSLALSKPNSNPDDGSEEPIMTGYLMKQGGAGILKTWRRRYFVLKRDHCLYYYKSEMEKDPIGAILLSNYMITKASDMSRKYAFKAVKYGAKSYHFAADNEHEMVMWANALNELAKSAGRTDTWLDISSPNVDVPALSIKAPDCHGNLCKLGVKRRVWRRRYCVLKDACIYHYLDLNANTAQGVAHLHGYTVLDSSPYSRKFTFTLQPPEERMRTFYFSADNETDQNRWITALRKSIGRWVKTD